MAATRLAGISLATKKGLTELFVGPICGARQSDRALFVEPLEHIKNQVGAYGRALASPHSGGTYIIDNDGYYVGWKSNREGNAGGVLFFLWLFPCFRGHSNDNGIAM
jgi:hypothetical protein